MTVHSEKWGYDERDVAAVKCLICKEPIGQESYVPVNTLARFGQLLFVHERCDDGEKTT